MFINKSVIEYWILMNIFYLKRNMNLFTQHQSSFPQITPCPHSWSQTKFVSEEGWRAFPEVKLEPVLCLGMLWAGCVAAGESGPHIPSVQYLKIWHVWHVSDCRVKCVILTRGSHPDCSSFKPILLQLRTHRTYIQGYLKFQAVRTQPKGAECRYSHLQAVKLTK